MAAEAGVSPLGVEQSRFKRVPDGWLFAMPRPWLFGPRPVYRVSEAQKAVLIARLRRVKYVRLLIVFLLVMPVVVLIVANPTMQDPASPWGWIALGVFMAVAIVVCAASEAWIIGHPLRGLRPTDARITFGDRLRMQADALSMRMHVLLAIVFLAAFVNAAYRAAIPLHGHSYSPFTLAAAFAFVFLFLRSVMLIAVKLTQAQNKSM